MNAKPEVQLTIEGRFCLEDPKFVDALADAMKELEGRKIIIRTAGGPLHGKHTIPTTLDDLDGTATGRFSPEEAADELARRAKEAEEAKRIDKGLLNSDDEAALDDEVTR